LLIGLGIPIDEVEKKFRDLNFNEFLDNPKIRSDFYLLKNGKKVIDNALKMFILIFFFFLSKNF
jgi:hypothetical protein